MTVLFSVLLLLIAIGALLAVLNRPQLVVIDAPIPTDFPDAGFSHGIFESLLQRYVDADGDVDYAAWHSNGHDRARLDSYLAAVAAYSPATAADRFPRQSDALAYWLYAYNAQVVRSVLEHWPLESVTDLKSPTEFVTGFGFFWRQRFLFGGEALSLYAVENDIIRKTFRDPRIHFVLNCASESCPVARPELPTGDDLEPFLDRATIEFVTDSDNVFVDHANRRVVVSDIFKWYEKDFINDLRRNGLPSERGLLDYLMSVAPPELADELSSASDYRIDYAGYDWALNSSEGS